jgi:MoxR-like ATPase
VPHVRFAPPRLAVEAARHGGLIFLDELTTAPPAVQAALLRAVVDVAFADLELDPERVTLVAAANPPDEAAGGWDLAPPLANRFVHHTYGLVAQDWTDAFTGYWGSAPRLVLGVASIRRSGARHARRTRRSSASDRTCSSRSRVTAPRAARRGRRRAAGTTARDWWPASSSPAAARSTR